MKIHDRYKICQESVKNLDLTFIIIYIKRISVRVYGR